MVKALDCGSGTRGFESRRLPHINNRAPKALLIRVFGVLIFSGKQSDHFSDSPAIQYRDFLTVEFFDVSTHDDCDHNEVVGENDLDCPILKADVAASQIFLLLNPQIFYALKP